MIVDGEYTQEDVEIQTREIIGKLMEVGIPEELQERVDEWLLAGKDDELRNELMFELFDEVFEFEAKPHARSYEMFYRFLSGDPGIAAQKKRVLFAYRLMQYRIIAGLIAAMATIGSTIFLFPAARNIAENYRKGTLLEITTPVRENVKRMKSLNMPKKECPRHVFSEG